MKILRIGSRGSLLARWQAEHIEQRLLKCHPGLRTEIRIIKTTGDRRKKSSLRQLGGKGVFVKEIEEALLEKRIDLAVHSLKDLPTEQPPPLVLAMIPKREDARDALICGSGLTHWEELPRGARIGTGSLRRQLQLKQLREDLQPVDLRGNVDTRLRKLESQDLQAIVLAAAGLLRLGRASHVTHFFSLQEMVPAVAQGALCVETRRDDTGTRDLLAPLEDPQTRVCAEAERAYLRAMGGGCQVPMGAHAWFEGERAHFLAFLAGVRSGRVLRTQRQGNADSLPRLVEQSLEELWSRGGKQLIAEQEA